MNLEYPNINNLKIKAQKARLNVVEMAHAAGDKGSHLASSLSSVEIYTVLYSWILEYDLMSPHWEERDRLIVGKEHGRLSEYSALYEAGFISKNDIENYTNDGNRLAGHPINISLGLEYSCCSLGMAFPVAVGVALSQKIKKRSNMVFTIAGDGELCEGTMWEAFMAAAHYKLNNLIVIIDRNGLSSDGETEKVMALGDLSAKIKAFGWKCIVCDNGNDIKNLVDAFMQYDKSAPTAIIANTVKGKLEFPLNAI